LSRISSDRRTKSWCRSLFLFAPAKPFTSDMAVFDLMQVRFPKPLSLLMVWMFSLGPILMGSFMSVLLLGVMIVQSYLYFRQESCLSFLLSANIITGDIRRMDNRVTFSGDLSESFSEIKPGFAAWSVLSAFPPPRKTTTLFQGLVPPLARLPECCVCNGHVIQLSCHQFR